MHVCKGGQISEVGAKFPRKYGPRGAKFPRKFGPGGGANFRGGAKFPVTPACFGFIIAQVYDYCYATTLYSTDGYCLEKLIFVDYSLPQKMQCTYN